MLIGRLGPGLAISLSMGRSIHFVDCTFRRDMAFTLDYAIRAQAVRELIAMNKVTLDYVPSEEQIPDILTKALPTALVSIFHRQLFVSTNAQSQAKNASLHKFHSPPLQAYRQLFRMASSPLRLQHTRVEPPCHVVASGGT